MKEEKFRYFIKKGKEKVLEGKADTEEEAIDKLSKLLLSLSTDSSKKTISKINR